MVKKIKKKTMKKIAIFIVTLVLIIAISIGLMYFLAPDFFNEIKDTIFELLFPNEDFIAVEGVLYIHFVDIGQGDFIIIQFPDNTNMIIDAGGSETSRKVKPAEKVTSYINKLGIKTFDYAMLTHSDEDHVDFMDNVINTFGAKTVYIPDLIASYNESDKIKEQDGKVKTKVYYDFIQSIDKPNIILEKNIDYKTFGDSFKFEMYSYGEDFYKTVTYGNAHEINDVSPICVLSFANRKVVFTGDAGEKAEANFIKTVVSPIDVDVLKLGHHGSSTSTSKAFLEFLDPEFTVASAGVDNKYGHPHSETIKRLSNYKDVKADKDYNGINKSYVTAYDGDIVLEIKGDGKMNFNTEKKSTNKQLKSFSFPLSICYNKNNKLVA